jgi:hypothetical protein
MSTRLEPKDPSDVKDYAIEWGTLLTAETETTISTSAWTVSDATLTIQSSPAPSIVGTKTIVWVSAGTAGITYELTNKIVTSGGRTHERSISLACLQR